MTPLGRVGRPEEIASVALFLGSDESSYVAEIDLPVDDGITAVFDLKPPHEPNGRRPSRARSLALIRLG